MLQTIRDKITGWFAAVFLGAIAIVFIFWGVELGSVTSKNYAAKVNGEQIPLPTIQKAWQDRQSRLQQMLKSDIPEEFKKSQQASLLDEFIRSRLLAQRVKDLGFRASDTSIAETLYGIPALQVDGKFSRDRYRTALMQQGMSESEFEQQLRADLAVSQLQNGVVGTAFVTPAEIARQQALEGEERELDYAIISAKSFAGSVQLKEEDIKAWYESHRAEFMTPETVDLQYLELRFEDTAKEVAVTDEALRAHYEQTKDRYESGERRRARHILFSVADGADDAAVKKQAEEVLAKLKAGGDFAALAKQYSKDPGSAANGGDLGWATRGMFVGPFEEALFSMKPGDLQGPVKTQFGYHLIKLDEAEAARKKSFEEVRAEVENEYRNERARSLFYDKTQKLADDSFAALTELDGVAKTFGVPLKTVGGFTRRGGGEFGAEQQVIDAAFMENVLEKGENSPLVTLGEDRALVLRVTDHKVPEQRPLEQVRNEIVARLKDDAAKSAAETQGQEALSRLQAGSATWDAVAKELKLAPAGKRYAGRRADGIAAPVLRSVFALPKAGVTETNPAYRGVSLDDGDYALVAVTGVRSGSTGAPAMQASSQRGGVEFGSYVAELERTAKIVRNSQAFE